VFLTLRRGRSCAFFEPKLRYEEKNSAPNISEFLIEFFQFFLRSFDLRLVVFNHIFGAVNARSFALNHRIRFAESRPVSDIFGPL
jgi:hypothetical protein